MKRRKFLLLSLAATGGLALAGCNVHEQPPALLAELCDAKAMLEIGREYLKKYPMENSRNELKKFTQAADVRADFLDGNIVVVKGWVLSRTEARQCALLTF